MTDERLDQRMRQWLELGPTGAPDGPVQAALLEVRGTPQVRAFPLRLRLPRLAVSARLAIGTAVVVAVVASGRLPGIAGVGGPGDSPVPTPSPSPSAVPTPAPTPSPAPIDTTAWVTFTSDMFGFSMQHAPDWTVVAASQPWDLKVARAFLNGSASDSMYSPSGNPNLLAFSMVMPTDMSEDAFITSFSTAATGGCFPGRDQWTAITIDGNPGWLMTSTCGAKADALTFVGGRVYGFTMWDRAQYPDGPLFRAMLESVRLDPSAAASAPPSGPGASALPSPSPSGS